jgi:hypothetical protein
LVGPTACVTAWSAASAEASSCYAVGVWSRPVAALVCADREAAGVMCGLVVGGA